MEVWTAFVDESGCSRDVQQFPQRAETQRASAQSRVFWCFGGLRRLLGGHRSIARKATPAKTKEAPVAAHATTAHTSLTCTLYFRNNYSSSVAIFWTVMPGFLRRPPPPPPFVHISQRQPFRCVPVTVDGCSPVHPGHGNTHDGPTMLGRTTLNISRRGQAREADESPPAPRPPP